MVVSAQHDESVSSYQIEELICFEVIEKIIPAEYLDRYVSGQLSPRPLGHPTSLGLTKLRITFKP